MLINHILLRRQTEGLLAVKIKYNSLASGSQLYCIKQKTETRSHRLPDRVILLPIVNYLSATYPYLKYLEEAYVSQCSLV